MHYLLGVPSAEAPSVEFWVIFFWPGRPLSGLIHGRDIRSCADCQELEVSFVYLTYVVFQKSEW